MWNEMKLLINIFNVWNANPVCSLAFLQLFGGVFRFIDPKCFYTFSSVSLCDVLYIVVLKCYEESFYECLSTLPFIITWQAVLVALLEGFGVMCKKPHTPFNYQLIMGKTWQFKFDYVNPKSGTPLALS